MNYIISTELFEEYNEYLKLYDFYLVEEKDNDNLRILEIIDNFGLNLTYYLYYEAVYLESEYINIKDDIFYKLLNRLLQNECSNIISREEEYVLTINRLCDCVDNFISYRRKQKIEKLLEDDI